MGSALGVWPLSSTRIAAIDAGSNAIRFIVADFTAKSGFYKTVYKKRLPIRLGHGVFTLGRLDESMMEAAVEAFRLFRAKMDRLGVQQWRAVATSATREASNRELFLKSVRRATAIELEPISGEEEARLTHLAVSSRVDMSTGRWMLVDLGGGSVEVSVVDESGVLWSESHQVGAVRLLETLEVANGCEKTLREWVEQQLGSLTVPAKWGGTTLGEEVCGFTGDATIRTTPTLDKGARRKVTTSGSDPGVPATRECATDTRVTPGALGVGVHEDANDASVNRDAISCAFAATGGNIKAIARLGLSYLDPFKVAFLSLDRLDNVIDLLTATTVRERIKRLGLRPDRADVILPAALVYRHFAQAADADQIVVPSVGVREGVLLDVAKRAEGAAVSGGRAARIGVN